MIVAGVDIGSLTAKAVILQGADILGYSIALLLITKLSRIEKDNVDPDHIKAVGRYDKLNHYEEFYFSGNFFFIDFVFIKMDSM